MSGSTFVSVSARRNCSFVALNTPFSVDSVNVDANQRSELLSRSLSSVKSTGLER